MSNSVQLQQTEPGRLTIGLESGNGPALYSEQFAEFCLVPSHPAPERYHRALSLGHLSIGNGCSDSLQGIDSKSFIGVLEGISKVAEISNAWLVSDCKQAKYSHKISAANVRHSGTITA